VRYGGEYVDGVDYAASFFMKCCRDVSLDNSDALRYFALQSYFSAEVLRMELHEALRQISTIRDAAARVEVFRGYRAASAGFSGLLGIAAAIVQAAWMPEPWRHVDPYLYLWGGVAVGSIVITGLELWCRTRRLDSPLAMRQTWQAVEQFLPCLVAGALVTLAIGGHAIEVVWMLPGLWAILFSLGMFASLRFLPRPLIVVAIHYLVCGVLYLSFAKGDWTLSPWAMGLTFGTGQLLAAAILYWTLEREHGQA
jgi:hypothetical protein